MTDQEYTQFANKWKPLFWVAFVYNLTAAIGPLAMPKFFTTMFFVTSPSNLSVVSLLHIQMAWVCVLSFGFGYAIVALNPCYNRGIVFLGLVGKVYVGILFGYFWLNGQVKLAAFLGGVGDILFAALFLLFLYKSRSQAKVIRPLLL